MENGYPQTNFTFSMDNTNIYTVISKIKHSVVMSQQQLHLFLFT